MLSLIFLLLEFSVYLLGLIFRVNIVLMSEIENKPFSKLASSSEKVRKIRPTVTVFT